MDFFNLDVDYEHRSGNIRRRLIIEDIKDVEMSVTHGTSKKTLKNYTVLNFRVVKNEQ